MIENRTSTAPDLLFATPFGTIPHKLFSFFFSVSLPLTRYFPLAK